MPRDRSSDQGADLIKGGVVRHALRDEMIPAFTNISTIRAKVYQKDKSLVYGLGALFIGTVFCMHYFIFEGSINIFTVVFLSVITLGLFGIWYPSFTTRNHVIEITPQFLRIDDCILKEIPWSEIYEIKTLNHFSLQFGRLIHLIIYLKNTNKYTCVKQGYIISKWRADGGLVATNLFDYKGGHNQILEDLAAALASSR